ncbi:TetR/AcrR family transcriptional regulator [uncultured Ilyobacter sp.]|uniref:TetR/AcrR family transcriptional regulator n=1 Tax=uncultured Ilyobacter sp. TaxID=544433 RepID=UPI0029F576F3|nr:TetR/AcrR family transcriptional regulator [uncultured Ilyobacter sp.]
MQVKKPEVKEKIYSAAFEEFYEKGFKKATMSTISDNSEVPVGNIYRYFTNKEAIFKDIVEEVSIELSNLFLNSSKIEYSSLDKPYSEILREEVLEFVEKLLDLSLKNKRTVQILFEKSHGSKFENFKKNLELQFIENAISNAKLNLKNSKLTQEDTELVKISAKVFLKGLETIMVNYSDNEELKRNLMFRFSDFFITDIGSRMKLGKI